MGHEVRLIPAAYVKPFVKRNKTDARDAAATCVAVRRPDMRPVSIKSKEQQASRALERSRDRTDRALPKPDISSATDSRSTFP